MKIIFLDIDGVLNSAAYDRVRGKDDGNIDETRLPLLKSIVDAAQAHIVLASSWRKHWGRLPSLCDPIGRELNATFAKYGLSIYDRTPERADGDRAAEIREWLAANEAVTDFVILDDLRFGWGELQDRLVNTNHRIGRGLEERHATDALRILNVKKT